MKINYPLYLIPHGGGYASIVDPETEAFHLLVVYEQEQPAMDFMSRFGMEGEPRFLKNDREFAWLLLALRDPVTHVAFDPTIEQGVVETRWSVTVQKLLDDHLQADFSPWDYPCFVVALDAGFASIEGNASDGQPLTALALFTTKERAEAYMADASESGSVCELTSLDEARRFLEKLAPQVAGVALDPTVGEAGSTAKYCFELATVLEKYLVRPTPPE